MMSFSEFIGAYEVITKLEEKISEYEEWKGNFSANKKLRRQLDLGKQIGDIVGSGHIEGRWQVEGATYSGEEPTNDDYETYNFLSDKIWDFAYYTAPPIKIHLITRKTIEDGGSVSIDYLIEVELSDEGRNMVGCKERQHDYELLYFKLLITTREEFDNLVKSRKLNELYDLGAYGWSIIFEKEEEFSGYIKRIKEKFIVNGFKDYQFVFDPLRIRDNRSDWEGD